MKKFMFSALACVAFAFSSFASNEVVEKNGFVWCRIQVTVMDEDGNKLEDLRSDSSTTKTYADSLKRSNEFVKSLELEGLNIDSVIVVG